MLSIIVYIHIYNVYNHILCTCMYVHVFDSLHFQDARGDQCDKCGRLINATELKVSYLGTYDPVNTRLSDNHSSTC